jgi:LEA14-like dessication related protein
MASTQVFSTAVRWILGVMLVVLASCASIGPHFEKPTVQVKRIQWVSGNWNSQRLKVGLGVRNDNAIALPLTGLDYELTLNTVKIGHGHLDQAVTIPAHADQIVEVDLELNLQTALVTVLPMLRDRSQAIHYEVTGVLQSSLLFMKELPFTLKGDWSNDR